MALVTHGTSLYFLFLLWPNAATNHSRFSTCIVNTANGRLCSSLHRLCQTTLGDRLTRSVPTSPVFYAKPLLVAGRPQVNGMVYKHAFSFVCPFVFYFMRVRRASRRGELQCLYMWLLFALVTSVHWTNSLSSRFGLKPWPLPFWYRSRVLCIYNTNWQSESP